mmetsp:Transcript_6615/g.19403  ORF Transcript_6615/g.19403 Transcript_6615/m.19403 type:complete len:209 (+) Transcript_6615:1076-1702(+)
MAFPWTSARRYTLRAMPTSCGMMRSPRDSEHCSLSSFNHFSIKLVRCCCKTGLATSILSCSLRRPVSRRVEKYCRTGGTWFGWGGICWNRAIVAGVRRAFPLAATTRAASATCPVLMRRSNSAANRFSAPGRFKRPASLMAKSLSRSVERMYGTTACPFNWRRKTFPVRTVIPKTAPVESWGQVTKTVSGVTFCRYMVFPVWQSNMKT